MRDAFGVFIRGCDFDKVDEWVCFVDLASEDDGWVATVLEDGWIPIGEFPAIVE